MCPPIDVSSTNMYVFLMYPKQTLEVNSSLEFGDYVGLIQFEGYNDQKQFLALAEVLV